MTNRVARALDGRERQRTRTRTTNAIAPREADDRIGRRRVTECELDNVAAFFRATFDAWKDYNRTGEESWYVGYSPIIGVDTARILRDLPTAHVLHVVRNPWAA